MSAVAEEQGLYRAAFERFRRAPEFVGVPWLVAQRERAMAAFERRGFPTTREEAWRATNVAPIARASFRRADDAAAADVPAAQLTRLGFDRAFSGQEIVFVNGRVARELSSLEPGAVRIRSLQDVLSTDPGRLESRLGLLLKGDGAQPFGALNDALWEDGALIEIAPGVVIDQPVHLLYLSHPGQGDEPTLSHPRTLVLAGKGSQATLIETYGGAPGERYFTNAVTEIDLEDGAALDHYKLQRESEAAFHVATLAVRQGRDARFSDMSISVGGALVRNDIEVRLDAEGAECTLNGLFVADGAQHMDTHSRIDHARPHGTSRELYKGILSGRSRGVFNGLIVVRPDAQKTDAWQVNQNLLLSADALVNSTPQLEIHADDVKCKHGSTTGQLDAQALFYLRSRGIGEEAARSLLTYAFASDVVGRIQVAPVRARLEAFLHERLPSAPREAVS